MSPRLLLALVATVLPGCVWYGPHTMTRVWLDRNTLNRPAFFIERLAIAPPPRERVERFRWQYGAGPGMPVTMHESVIVAPMPGEMPFDPANTGPGADASTPPSAPPPEPAACTPEPTRSRNLAWLFSPNRG